MRGRLWSLITAAIGLAILVLLVLYGTAQGIWRDEAGPLEPAPPSLAIPFAIGGLAAVLVIGGVITAFSGSPARTDPPHRVDS